mmetsp:Transcript_8041/g.10872  ORF Transcript_8041/g.10872 Transcript_8041/m.10872 type:complete len:268 (+) Transcript_8041:729-1532(+)
MLATVSVEWVLHTESLQASHPGSILLRRAVHIAVVVLGAELFLPGWAQAAGALGEVVAELQLISKELHPQQCRNENKQQKDQRQIRNGRKRVEDGADDLIELLPRARELENAQQAKGAQDGEGAGAGAACHHIEHHFQEREHHHQPIKDVHSVPTVGDHPEADEFDYHLQRKVCREDVINPLQRRVHRLRRAMILAGHGNGVEHDESHGGELKGGSRLEIVAPLHQGVVLPGSDWDHLSFCLCPCLARALGSSLLVLGVTLLSKFHI